jgi:hypothetical protein
MRVESEGHHIARGAVLSNATVDDLFGAWAEPVATKSLSEPEPTMWSLDVSSPEALSAQRDALFRDEANLTDAATRLSAFIDAWQPGDGESAREKSLVAQSPEDRLRDALLRTTTPSAQSKDLFDPLRDAKAEFDAFIMRVRDLTSALARVETSANGSPIANTLVRWTGDVDTVWAQTTTFEQIGLHRENVHIALARRAMLMRLVVAISAGAVRIMIRLATPGAQLLVLPALWQFVQDVVAQIRAMKSESFAAEKQR